MKRREMRWLISKIDMASVKKKAKLSICWVSIDNNE
jgi:hypothetical protein